ncbi:MAG: LPXTG cell wall anchor domain-containing protein [Acidimicrobiales bacterium]
MLPSTGPTASVTTTAPTTTEPPAGATVLPSSGSVGAPATGATVAADQALPTTGASTEPLWSLAIGLLGVGVVAVAFGRKRSAR